MKLAGEALKIKIEPLPSYSPDFLPVEHLWQWLRKDITYHRCYLSKTQLIEEISQFELSINSHTLSLSERLWVENHLDLKKKNYGSQLRRSLVKGRKNVTRTKTILPTTTDNYGSIS